MTYDKDVFGPLPKKKTAVFHHPIGFVLYDELAMDLHAMTYAEQCVAAVRAKSAERDELLAALQRIADGQEMSGVFTFADVVLRYQEIARAAIAKATGEQL
jgi:hypothetical protein